MRFNERKKNFLFFCHLKNYLSLHIMAEQNNPLMAQLNSLLEAEPPYDPVVSVPIDLPEPINIPVPINIPELREQLAILVSTGRCKEAIGVNLTQEQVGRLDEKDVIKYNKGYEAYVGSKTNDTLIDNFLSLAIKWGGKIVEIDDAEALQNELKSDFIINKEMRKYAGKVSLKFGSSLAILNAVAIIAKHVAFSTNPVAVVNAAAIAAKHVNIGGQITEQSPVITEELPSNTEEFLS